jgi:dienelactone hydrolase
VVAAGTAPAAVTWREWHGWSAAVPPRARAHPRRQRLRRPAPGRCHTVHVPDLYDGRVFATLEDGAEYAAEIGFGTVIERGQAVAAKLPAELVYAGFSLGVLPAQMLTQTRPGATGALLFEACVPLSEFGGTWPAGVPVQVHGMEDDEFFAGEGDIDAARALVQATPDAELFLYPGHRHLFTDSSLPSYDESAATQLTQRVLAFLERIR